MALLDAPRGATPDVTDTIVSTAPAARVGWRDVIGLTSLLFALLMLMPTGPFTTDEGEILLQLQVLADSARWEAPYPAIDLDPSGDHMPVYQIERDGVRFLPHVKHPVWTAALLPVFEFGGLTAVLVVHLLSLLAAAGGAARLVRRLGSNRERQAFWLVGIASPVTVGAFVAWGHAPGVAAATLAILWLATPSHAASRTTQARDWTLGAVALFVGVLIRNEVVLLGVALFVALVLRRHWRPALAAAAATGGAYALNASLVSSIWGPKAFPFRVIDPEADWLSGRITGLSRSLLGFEPTVPAAAVAMVAVVGAWLTVRSSGRSPLGRLGRLLVVAAPVASIAWWPVEPVAGLLVVCPILALAALADGSQWRRVVRGDAGTVVGVIAGATALVLATQYSDGGGLQWGGRFLHVVVPAVFALVLVALDQSTPAGSPDRTRVPMSLAVAAVLWTFAGVLSVSHLRWLNATVVDALVTQARADADAGGVTGPPVVMGDFRVLGALVWQQFDDVRALDARPDELEQLSQRLDAADIERWTLVWTEPSPPERIGEYDSVDRRTDPTSSLWLISMERR